MSVVRKKNYTQQNIQQKFSQCVENVRELVLLLTAVINVKLINILLVIVNNIFKLFKSFTRHSLKLPLPLKTEILFDIKNCDIKSK